MWTLYGRKLVVMSQNQNISGKHEMKKNGNCMTEPAVLRMQVHLDCISHKHNCVIDIAEFDEKLAKRQSSHCEKSCSSGNVQAYFAEKPDDYKLTGQKRWIRQES